MTLEDMIADAVKRGELVNLSVYAKDGAFHASFCPASKSGIAFAEHADPVEAMKAAIKSVKLARPSRVSKPTEAPDEDMDFG